MNTNDSNNIQAGKRISLFSSWKREWYAGSRKHWINAILAVAYSIVFCTWLGYITSLPATIWSTTQKTIAVSVDQLENGQAPFQLNWELSGFQPAIESCIPQFFNDGEDVLVNPIGKPDGFFLPLATTGPRSVDGQKRPVVVLYASSDYLNQDNPNAPDLNGEALLKLAAKGRLSGHRSFLPEPISYAEHEELQVVYPNHSAEDFVVFCVKDSSARVLAERAGVVSFIVFVFAAIALWSARTTWKKYLSEKQLESNLRNNVFCHHQKCEPAIEFIQQHSNELGKELIEPFNPPAANHKAKLHPIVALTLLGVSVASYLGMIVLTISLLAHFLLNAMWLQAIGVLLVAALFYRILRCLMAYLAEGEPESLSRWSPEQPLEIDQAAFYQYHSRMLDSIGFSKIGESGTRHFFACPSHRLLAVLGVQRRDSKNYFSLVSVLEGGEVVQTSSFTKTLRRRSIAQPNWYVNPADTMTFCEALQSHQNLVKDMPTKAACRQFAVKKSNYEKVVKHIDGIYESAWSSMLRNTWFGI